MSFYFPVVQKSIIRTSLAETTPNAGMAGAAIITMDIIAMETMVMAGKGLSVIGKH